VVDQLRMHDELRQVYRLMSMGAALSPEDRLAPGDPVKILHGPFEGFTGKVVVRGNHTRLIVEVQFLHQGVSVDIENGMVAPIKATNPVLSGKIEFSKGHRVQTAGVS
jgi:transcription antitermination factor NusG